jgi:hypothetical protein
VTATSTCSSLLVEAAWSAVHTDTRLKARYHRLVLRFGGYHNPAAKKNAVIAIAHALLVIIRHVLAAGPTPTLAPTPTPVAPTPIRKPAG